MADSVHSIHSTTIDGTIEELQQQNPPFTVIIGTLDGDIKEYRTVVTQSSDLVHSGDYVKLHPVFCQAKKTSLVFLCSPWPCPL